MDSKVGKEHVTESADTLRGIPGTSKIFFHSGLEKKWNNRTSKASRVRSRHVMCEDKALNLYYL